MTLPDFKYEQPLWDDGYIVVGVDEVGRGCLAGPVYIGAVCIPPDFAKNFIRLKVNDSKKLSIKRREYLTPLIKKKTLAHAVASSSVEIINKRGIVFAVNRAIRQAIKQIQVDLQTDKIHILMDAFYIKGIARKRQTPIIGGDTKSISIAAASIIAKVERDTVMKQLSEDCPQYGWSKNKGYATEAHREAIKKHGLHALHRKLYVRKVMASKQMT